MSSYSIAVLGAGNVGARLAELWAGVGHKVVFGLPNPQSEKSRTALSKLGGKVHAATNQEAARSADIITLCVPWPQAQNAIESCGNLGGKIVVDCVNPLWPDLKGLTLGTTTSAGEKVAEWAKGAHVVKAFNTIGAVNFGHARFGDLRADGFYCGDDTPAKNTVKELIEDAGLDPVDVGPLRNARQLEALAMLWIDLAVNQRQGPNHAFKLLRR
jgi:8-hydroxy-5-deazaflavin:NADPH oxidoreductase